MLGFSSPYTPQCYRAIQNFLLKLFVNTVTAFQCRVDERLKCNMFYVNLICTVFTFICVRIIGCLKYE
jgi:hypothetical protein